MARRFERGLPRLILAFTEATNSQGTVSRSPRHRHVAPAITDTMAGSSKQM